MVGWAKIVAAKTEVRIAMTTRSSITVMPNRKSEIRRPKVEEDPTCESRTGVIGAIHRQRHAARLSNGSGLDCSESGGRISDLGLLLAFGVRVSGFSVFTRLPRNEPGGLNKEFFKRF